MKILYAVQATGNGHISRAHQLFPHLSEWGEVDILLSGSNSTLAMELPVTYRAHGLSLFYNQCGGLDYWKSFSKFNWKRVKQEARDLPVEKYDIIINDFDHITARACREKGVPSVQFGHQASFMSPATPRPKKRSILGEFILKNYAPATHYVGLHFDRYDNFVFPPIIKDTFLNARPQNHGHITVYLPSYDKVCLTEIFKEASPVPIHWFAKEVVRPFTDGNIHYFPIDQTYFNESLIHCHGLLTGGGFETPAEALYLGKKLLTIPIQGQYEQECNAAALQKAGVDSLPVLDRTSKHVFFDWIYSSGSQPVLEANNITETLSYMMHKAHTWTQKAE
jgi:uncharacterized protein (TIGR00661 family)